jgi:hypothetical protein
VFCRHCGTQARPGDQHCTKCGQPLGSTPDPESGSSSAPYAPPRTARFRLGRFVAAHAKGMFILLVVAGIGTAAALSAGSGDTTPGPDDAAPAAAVAGEEAAVDRQSTTPATADTKVPKRVGVTGSDGRTYYCSGAALDDADAKKARADRREKVLDQRKRAFRHFLATHPEKDLAPADYKRYKTLRARYRAQLRYTNIAVDSYNQVLDSRCDPR